MSDDTIKLELSRESIKALIAREDRTQESRRDVARKQLRDALAAHDEQAWSRTLGEPWRYMVSDRMVLDSSGARLCGDYTQPEQFRLIAAAPDLARALAGMVDFLESLDDTRPHMPKEIAAARAALRAAGWPGYEGGE